MTIFQIECFLAVAEHLNFARASRQLNVSQPAITRQLRTLEEELGTQLFIRSTRMVRPHRERTYLPVRCTAYG